jgi:hypothetical protein
MDGAGRLEDGLSWHPCCFVAGFALMDEQTIQKAPNGMETMKR